MGSLSASTFAFNGFLLDSDIRLEILERGCEDRTKEERTRIHKGRNSPVDLFISEDIRNKDKYNDNKTVFNE